MPSDVPFRTVDIETVRSKGFDVKATPMLMVFVDGKLQAESTGLLRGDGLKAFLGRWGFDRDNDSPDDNGESLDSDDFNPWTNPRRWNKGPIRDRIDNAKTQFAWWLLGKWLGFGAGGLVLLFPWLILAMRFYRKMRETDKEYTANKQRSPSRRSRKNTKKSKAVRNRISK
jgi:hypothetical protein